MKERVLTSYLLKAENKIEEWKTEYLFFPVFHEVLEKSVRRRSWGLVRKLLS